MAHTITWQRQLQFRKVFRNLATPPSGTLYKSSLLLTPSSLSFAVLLGLHGMSVTIKWIFPDVWHSEILRCRLVLVQGQLLLGSRVNRQSVRSWSGTVTTFCSFTIPPNTHTCLPARTNRYSLYALSYKHYEQDGVAHWNILVVAHTHLFFIVLIPPRECNYHLTFRSVSSSPASSPFCSYPAAAPSWCAHLSVRPTRTHKAGTLDQ